jgi:hypothetical protein
MPVQLREENGGKILVVHPFERLFRQQGKLLGLFDMIGFNGCEAKAM